MYVVTSAWDVSCVVMHFDVGVAKPITWSAKSVLAAFDSDPVWSEWLLKYVLEMIASARQLSNTLKSCSIRRQEHD